MPGLNIASHAVVFRGLILPSLKTTAWEASLNNDRYSLLLRRWRRKCRKCLLYKCGRKKRRLSQARRVAKSQNRMYVKVKCFISRLLHIKDVQHFFGTVNKTDTRSEYDIYYLFTSECTQVESTFLCEL